jgi:hypothetical protein
MPYQSGSTIAKHEEPGHYYVRDEQGRVRVVEFYEGRVLDPRILLSSLCEYELIGPVPMPEELHSLVTACSEVGETNPVKEQTL